MSNEVKERFNPFYENWYQRTGAKYREYPISWEGLMEFIDSFEGYRLVPIMDTGIIEKLQKQREEQGLTAKFDALEQRIAKLEALHITCGCNDPACKYNAKAHERAYP